MAEPIREMKVGQLLVAVYPDIESLGRDAAAKAAEILRNAIELKGYANAILATGNSQITMLAALSTADVDWSKVRLFHMDEYIGLPPEHSAGFRRFLHEKIIDHVQPSAFFGIQGDTDDIAAECLRYADLLRRHPADLCCLGIGENGHIAFNDPPYADFSDPHWVKVVELDEMSRRQQVGEGHFPTMDDVPRQAITLTIPALLAARRMLCIAPERRKAMPVKEALTGPISTNCPASILRSVSHVRLFLDQDSASLL